MPKCSGCGKVGERMIYNQDRDKYYCRICSKQRGKTKKIRYR